VKEKEINKATSLNNPSPGEATETAGHTPPARSTWQKRGGDKLSSPEDLCSKAAPLLRRGLGEGAADAGGGEDPHQGLQRPQLEAEDEVVTDAETVAEGECPPAPREDGIAARSKDDVNRLEELWPTLLH
jgi:hypothetical protein